MTPIPITMQNFALTWTDSTGKAHASPVAYDKGSANSRKTGLGAGGHTDVKVVPIMPGKLPNPERGQPLGLPWGAGRSGRPRPAGGPTGRA